MAPTVPSAERLEVGALLARSWAVLRAHPVIAPSLGAAVVLSLASTVFGIGVLATPWFACEIFALQLAVLSHREIERGASWFRAGFLVLAMVGVVVAATWLAALAIGPDVATADSAAAPLPWPEALRRVALITTVTAVAVGFFAPFVYAPLILIERGGSLGAAAVESAWLVRRGGLARHWGLAFLAHLLPLAPAIVAAVAVARTFERAATPLGVLAGLPLLPLSIPLGQGLVTAAYVQRRRELSEPRWTRREGRPPRSLVIGLGAVVLAPMVSVGLLALGALRPAPPSAGASERGQVVLDWAADESTTMFIAGTTLSVQVSGRALEVRGGDGGEVHVEDPSTPIDRVRVRRSGDRYIVEAHTRGWWTIEVDRAAVRTDDTVGARLEARLPPWGLIAIALAFAASALLLIHTFAELGEVRRLYGAPASSRPPITELRGRREEALRRSWKIVALLAIPNGFALAAGARALFG